MTDPANILSRVEAVLAAATDGPWREVGRDVDHDKMVAAGRNPGDACGLGCEVEGPPEAYLRGQFDRHADATFIAFARNTYPEALAVVRAARLVSQWHDSIGSGPIEELNAELGELADLCAAFLAKAQDATEAGS